MTDGTVLKGIVALDLFLPFPETILLSDQSVTVAILFVMFVAMMQFLPQSRLIGC